MLYANEVEKIASRFEMIACGAIPLQSRALCFEAAEACYPGINRRKRIVGFDTVERIMEHLCGEVFNKVQLPRSESWYPVAGNAEVPKDYWTTNVIQRRKLAMRAARYLRECQASER